MVEDSAVIIFENRMTGFVTDIEVPLQISANDLIVALNDVCSLGIDSEDIFECYLVAEHPIASFVEQPLYQSL